MYNITFQQIEAFLTIARHLNMSKAAESLYISQPTLSKALQRFEKGIGFEVFTRSNKGVMLTPQGEYLFDALESLYNNMDKAIKTAKDITLKEKKQLRIIVPSSYDVVKSYDDVKKGIREYEQLNPDVVLSVQLFDFSELRSQLEFGEMDIAFTHEFIAETVPDIEYVPVAEYPLYIAFSTESELAECEELQPMQLEKYTVFAVRQMDVNVARENVLHNCQSFGFKPKKVELVDNFQTMLHLIRSNKGISVCAKFEGSRGIKYYSSEKLSGNTEVVMVWHPDKLNKLSKDFIKLFHTLEQD